jgi:long-chain acyl-CoA synthetase
MDRGLAAVLAESFQHNREKTAVIQQERGGKVRVLSYEELAGLSLQLNAVIPEVTTHKRSLGIFMRRSPEHVAAILSALTSGACYFSANPMVSSVQIAEMVRTADPGVLVCDNSTLLKLTTIAGDALTNTRIVHLADGPLNGPFKSAFDKIARFANIETVTLETGSVGELASMPRTASEAAQVILFTSGSTGSPRGVMIGERDLSERIDAEATAYQVGSTDTLLGMLPFSFDVGCNQLLTSLTRGSQIVLLNSWLAADILNAIEEQGVTGISGVPAIWETVLKANEARVCAAFAKLRYLTISGGDMSEANLARLRALGPHLKIFKTYGQTETFRSSMLMPEAFDQRSRSVGRPPPGVNIYVVKDDGQIADHGEIGEIVHEGTGTMMAYAGDPDATAAKRRPNTFRPDSASEFVIFTGDRGKLDQDGFLYVLGRMDRMIKVRGNRVYPEEVERQLLSHPEVSEAVVALLKKDETPQLLAGIRPANETLKPLDVSRFLMARLPSYMVPERIEIVDHFPRTSTGKIDMQRAASLLADKRKTVGTAS